MLPSCRHTSLLRRLRSWAMRPPRASSGGKMARLKRTTYSSPTPCAPKVCPSGGTDPQDRERAALAARAALLRPSDTSSEGGQGGLLGSIIVFAASLLFRGSATSLEVSYS
jgi:hypothetical protein